MRTLVLALALAAPATAQGAVHVVDQAGGAGVDFLDIPPAIAASAPGDTLLVKPGSYSGFTLSKPLQITAETNAIADVGPFLVEDLGPGDTVVLRGLRVDGSPATSVVRNSLGWVGLEDCELDQLPTAPIAEVLRIEDCASVTLVRCSVEGGILASVAGPTGGVGLLALDSSVHLHGTTVRGGWGGLPPVSPGLAGADAVVQSGGFLLVEGGILEGGKGSDANEGEFSCQSPAQPGGSGLRLEGAAPQGFVRGATLQGGGGGAPDGFLCPAGAPPGPPTEVTAGTLTDLGGSALTLDVETPARMGAPTTTVAVGVPGDVVVVGIGLAPAASFFPAWLGVIQVDPILATLVLGTVPAGGVLAVDSIAPSFPAFESVQLFEQAVFIGVGNQLTLASPSLPLVVDPAF